VSHTAQLSNALAHRSICAGVTRSGSPTIEASMRASCQPVRQSAWDNAWSRPSSFASDCMVPIDTPNTFFATIP
jgi:hypothetical protein